MVSKQQRERRIVGRRMDELAARWSELVPDGLLSFLALRRDDSSWNIPGRYLTFGLQRRLS